MEQVRRSGDRTLALVTELTHLQAELTDIIRDLTGTANADLATVLMEQPYVRMRNVLDRCSVSRPTASGWLKKLSQAGVVSDIRVGRDVVYVNHLEKARRTVHR